MDGFVKPFNKKNVIVIMVKRFLQNYNFLKKDKFKSATNSLVDLIKQQICIFSIFLRKKLLETTENFGRSFFCLTGYLNVDYRCLKS